MSLVHFPLVRTDPHARAHAGPTVRAMEIGQHVIAIALTAVGVIRAIGDGTEPPAAIIAGIAILAWHTAGTVLPARSGSPKLASLWLLGFAAIWVATVAVSPEFIWLAFLLWLLAGHLLPLFSGLLFSGAVLGGVVIVPVLHHGTTTTANVLGPLIGGVFAFGISRGYLHLLREAAERERLVASLSRSQAETAALQDELALAQRHSGAIAERTRISRDIHDTVAQSLSSIRLLAHAGAGRSEDADAARTLSQIEALSGDSLADVRRIVAALAPVELEDGALAAALRRMLDRMGSESQLRTELHVDGSLPLLPTEVEVALLRSAQSALANVRIHSQASRVVVSLIDAEDSVRLDIIDDGVGFSQEEAEGRGGTANTSGGSFGLKFMRARLRELGGGLDVESTPGAGTAISAHLPLAADHPRPTEPAPRTPSENAL